MPPPPATPVGYALPVPSALVAADPKLIGEGTAVPRHAGPAGPVSLPVAAGTPVDAVTAGTITITPAAGGTSTVVLSGADGATYTYRGVTVTPAPGPARHQAARRQKVRAGTRIGVSRPGGLTFSISVPDTSGAVDAEQALEDWASGLSVNVHSLPSTIAPASAAPSRAQALLVTDSGSRAASAGLIRSLSGPQVRVRAETVADPRPVRHRNPVARQIASAARRRLVIVVLAHGTPGQLQAIAARLPAGRPLLWVAPPGTTAKQAAADRAIAAAHPGLRVESLPAALAPARTPAKPGPALPPMSVLATDTLTSAYAVTAYRLDSPATQAAAELSWAENQLGKPYQWGAAGLASYDCSGLTMDALAQAGVGLPHNADAQWRQTKSRSVAENRLVPGDLVFFAGADGTRTAPGHVGIYVGDGEIIDSPYRGARVRFDRVSGIPGYVGATNPFAPLPGAAPGGLMPAPGNLPVPGNLSQYQNFARGLVARTWGSSQFPFLYMLWERESGWNPAATNPLSGAFGIPQALPAVKMATAGVDWATDAYTQITWGIGYIQAAYGTPRAAWAHEVAFGWY